MTNDQPRPIGERPTGARKKSLKERLAQLERGPVTNGYYKSFDGTRIFYSIEGNGKPLIFCYGLVCSSLHWTYQIERFQRDYRTIWSDYRGHQNSALPEDLDSLTLPNLARDLGVLFDELDIKDAVLLGHSMGVNVVLEFYRQFPDRVHAMVLSNGTPKPPLETLFNSNVTQAAFNALIATYRLAPDLLHKLWKLQKDNPISQALIGLAGFNTHLTPIEDIALYVNQVADLDPRVFLNLIKNYDHYDATPWLHTIKAPTLILAGEDDKICPIGQQELMHQLIPGSRLERIRHGSHCPQMDLPELFNEKIEIFLKEIGYAP